MPLLEQHHTPVQLSVVGLEGEEIDTTADWVPAVVAVSAGGRDFPGEILSAQPAADACSGLRR